MSSFDIEFAAVTDIGKIREKNEDNVLISSDLGLGVVADGMGGHSAGEIASNIAVSVLAETVRKVNNGQLKIPQTFLPKLDETERKILMAANLANAAIYSTAQSSDIYKMMGTTLTGVIFDKDFATAVHVGDSRLYLFRDDKIVQITTDHSLAMEHVRRGLLTRAEADRSKIQNVLTRAMGIKKNIEFDLLKFPVKVGDVLLLCSDGLYKGLRESDMAAILQEGKETAIVKLCRRLVREANDKDGQDNISAVLIKILLAKPVTFKQRLKRFFSRD
ncbi:MAG: Stp1/IreP family PP2C-type Ser/Thr phosphatase [Elusimicrobia bacterium]|nr:Stp1/IreP family PP2C-type Ser/Thr phosphatase [Elusimicrobiota bacterium]MDD7578737.1 Stp1/IreP family PP2C-type Ser/Thr phosphatase [Elusimicrobiota bacterium]MDY6040007.1 Stp1/IreP family PP2C-type Ser/Thr phosphatase [Elusimicrobiaceae bacterium]